MGKTNAYTAAKRDGRILLNANESSLNLSAQLLQKAADIVTKISYNRYPDPAETELLSAFGSAKIKAILLGGVFMALMQVTYQSQALQR
ncbi:MAG: hypothetical protein U0K47_02580, partial [Erysipelotrichaceae bacterium]|nr:hypothetical protein [Erysipelotrichaceae bacterium]